MNCTICKEPMITAELEQVEIDFCGRCGGIWLDAGELDILLENSPQDIPTALSLQPAKNCTEKHQKCPICRRKMEKAIFGAVHNTITLDRCPAGCGLWFDHGELAAVLRFGKQKPDNKIVKILNEMFGDNKSQ